MPQNRTPRYVPTLTEVVAPPPQGSGLELAALTAEVLKTVGPLVEQELHKVMQAQITEQLSNVLPGLQQEIEQAVRVAIEQALEAAKTR